MMAAYKVTKPAILSKKASSVSKPVGVFLFRW
jgi:hypothetical protein